MKKPMLAFILNFFLPGAGLAYLGRWMWGILNLLIILAIGAFLVFLLPENNFANYFRWASYGLAGGSGGLAYAVAKQQNLNQT